MKPTNLKLYNEIKERIYKEQPKHSLYRSARIIREYKKEGGIFEGEKSNNINQWFNEKWISLNDYINDKIIPCGSDKVNKEYYPLCRPLKIAQKMTKPQILKLLKEKDKLKEKPLQTEKILKTKRFNINKENK
jgi:hypothetical protein